MNHLMVLCMATILCSVAPAAAAPSARWPAEKAWAWYRTQPWLCGINYVPSTASNTTEFWHADTFDEKVIDRELGWAQGLGFNTCRVFVQYLVWKHDPEGLKKRLDRFLGIAAGHGISTIVVPFDDCVFGDPWQTEPYLGKQRDPIPGMILPSWTPSPGLAAVTDQSVWPDLEKYIRDIIGSFAHDARVVLWDLYNEPGNSGMGDKSLPLLRATFAWAAAANPDQPLTVSVWTGAMPNLSALQIACSDVVSFHAYTNLEGMKQAIAGHKSHGRPVICTEWMARLQGSRWDTDLALLKSENVGCYAWGFVNGRTQAQFPWGSKRDAPEPKVWFHDLLRRDGSPYDPAEVAVIRRITDAPGVSKLKPLFDFPVRDTCVCLANGVYYLTGTTGHPTWWQTNEGIRVWKSSDLAAWEPRGLVWTFERDGTWQKKFVDGKRAIWAPEIHYFKNTFWLSYCVNYGGTGILRSTSGAAEGPYVDVKPDGPLTGEIDASLFCDDDGAVYFVYQNGKIARLTDDMTRLAEEPRLLKPAGGAQVGFEGAFMFKANGCYHLSCADFVNGEYHDFVARARNIDGPYGDRFLAVPHGGHNMFFKDREGAWWSTFFGNDVNAPFKERPGMLRVEFVLDGSVRPLLPAPGAGKKP
jgi:hypothetical protein